MRCAHVRDLLPGVLYGDLGVAERAGLDAHLAACGACRDELAALEATAALLAAARPAPRPGALDYLWTRLAPQLDAIDGARRRGPRVTWRWRRWHAAAAALVVFVLGLMVGRVLFTPGAEVAPPPAAAALENLVLAARVDAFLSRATPLLLALSNRRLEEAGAVDRGAERRLALVLVEEATLLRADLERGRGAGERALVGDLERVFLQVANLDVADYTAGVEVVQATLEREAILLRLSLERLRAEGARSTL